MARRNRYREFEYQLTRVIIADAAVFVLYLLFAGLGVGFLKWLLAIVAIVGSGLFAGLLYLNGEWRKIGGYTNKNTMTLTAAMDASGTETSDIVTMNEITLSGFSLTKLEVDYIPRVR